MTSTVLEALNRALHEAMLVDERVYFLGEDVLDPYGGAFKIARGLSTSFADRVFTTPISEAGIVGVATGMALRGLRPVVEIMFGDFLGLACDQILNHASKFRSVYNDRVRVPLVIRTPMGGRRGYGATHSQSIEKHWLGIPGLRVVAPNTIVDPCALLKHAILEDDDPVLFIEHKLLYGKQVLNGDDLNDFRVDYERASYPSAVISFEGVPGTITFVCYGYMFELVRDAMIKLVMDYELFTEAVVFAQLSPVIPEILLQSLSRTKQLITVEEGSASSGWGSEIAARIVEMQGKNLRAMKRIGALETAIASTRVLEEKILPSIDDIVDAALQMTRPKGNYAKDISTAGQYE